MVNVLVKASKTGPVAPGLGGQKSSSVALLIATWILALVSRVCALLKDGASAGNITPRTAATRGLRSRRIV